MINITKPVFYITLASIVFTSCKTASTVAVPAGTNTIVDITVKKIELSGSEKDNWHHLDLATDTIPGMSVDKAYQFLKGKTGVEVIVGVVDSGTDLTHEDLKDVAWVNKNEIAGNGIDDDKNGYVDDINGWNFLGKTYKEHLEYERILMNPSITDEETLAEAKAYQQENLGEANQNKFRYQNFLSNVLFADEAFKKHFGKDDYTFEEIKGIDPSNTSLNDAKGVAGFVESNGYTMSGIKEELTSLVKNPLFIWRKSFTKTCINYFCSVINSITNTQSNIFIVLISV